MEATLIAHSGTKRVSYEELCAIPAPDSTRYWKPVTHAELVDSLEESLNQRGLIVDRKQFAIGHNGLKLFGTFDLSRELTTGIGQAIGFRHSNDKSIALQTVGGARIFVCDNMAFSGDVTILKHKHTWNFSLKDLIQRGLDIWQGKQGAMVADIDRMRNQVIEVETAKALLAHCLYDGTITFATFKQAYNLYFEKAIRQPGAFEDCAPRTTWGLHNAITRALKTSTPGVAFNSTIDMAKVFGFGSEPTYAMA